VARVVAGYSCFSEGQALELNVLVDLCKESLVLGNKDLKQRLNKFQYLIVSKSCFKNKLYILKYGVLK
jgi:hypothetical protein